MKTYVFTVELEDEDNRWVAEVPSLPGCVSEGDTREETIEALRDTAQAYLEVMKENGDSMPQEAEGSVKVIAGAAVVVTVWPPLEL